MNEADLLKLIPDRIKSKIAARGDGIHETILKLVNDFEVLEGLLDAAYEDLDWYTNGQP